MRSNQFSGFWCYAIGKVAESPQQNCITTFLYLYDWFCTCCEHDAKDCDISFSVGLFVEAFPVCPVQNTPFSIDQKSNLYNTRKFIAMQFDPYAKTNKILRLNAICIDFSGNLSNLLLSLVSITRKLLDFTAKKNHRWEK